MENTQKTFYAAVAITDDSEVKSAKEMIEQAFANTDGVFGNIEYETAYQDNQKLIVGKAHKL